VALCGRRPDFAPVRARNLIYREIHREIPAYPTLHGNANFIVLAIRRFLSEFPALPRVHFRPRCIVNDAASADRSIHRKSVPRSAPGSKSKPEIPIRQALACLSKREGGGGAVIPGAVSNKLQSKHNRGHPRTFPFGLQERGFRASAAK